MARESWGRAEVGPRHRGLGTPFAALAVVRGKVNEMMKDYPMFAW